MGRKLGFDKDAALALAMDSFWAQGYSATSMRDLSDKMGLYLASIYNAFGDKQRVFEEAMRLNIETHVLPNFNKLTKAEDPMGAIDAFMERIVVECGGAKSKPGCFLVNSLLEITTINDSVTKTLYFYLQKMEDALALCIKRAKDMGQIPASTKEKRAARFLLTSLFSLRVMGKLEMPTPFLRDIKESTLQALRSGIS